MQLSSLTITIYKTLIMMIQKYSSVILDCTEIRFQRNTSEFLCLHAKAKPHSVCMEIRTS